MTSSHRRLRRTSAAAAILLSAAVACSPTDGSAAVTVPSPGAELAKHCEALHRELPQKVNENAERRDTTPESPYTAAWGDPAIVLRCGIDRPAAVMNPENNGVEVNDVSWVYEDLGEDGIRFISRYREPYVEILIPASYHADAGVLVDFAKPVAKTVPVTLDD